MHGRSPLESERPRPAPSDRIAIERRIYSVEPAVTQVLQEDDQDLHVVHWQPGNKQPGEERDARRDGGAHEAHRLRARAP